MPGLHEYLLFVAAGVMLNITPGADMLFVVTTAGRYGAGRGVAGALGVFGGTLVHIALAVVGLSAMLAASALAFSVVKYVGAAYLLYLGITLLLARGDTQPVDETEFANASEPKSMMSIFGRGVLINVLNPKIALFFLAFLPQFIDATAANHSLAFAVLGLTFNCTGTLVNCLAALATAGIGRLSWAQAAGRWLQRVVGGLFIALAARLAFEPAR